MGREQQRDDITQDVVQLTDPPSGSEEAEQDVLTQSESGNARNPSFGKQQWNYRYTCFCEPLSPTIGWAIGRDRPYTTGLDSPSSFLFVIRARQIKTFKINIQIHELHFCKPDASLILPDFWNSPFGSCFFLNTRFLSFANCS